MTISIEFKDGFYYWILKDETGITNGWGKSLGDVFEQIIEDREKMSLIKGQEYHVKSNS